MAKSFVGQRLHRTNIAYGLTGFGALLCVIADSIYYQNGYGWPVMIMWLSGLLCMAGGFAVLQGDNKKPKLLNKRKLKLELLTLLLLLVAFAPVYLWSVHTLPVQVNSDEVAIMSFDKQLARNGHIDPLGVSTNFGLPSFIFLAFGKIGQLMGGVNLANMRTLHALSGLAIVGCCYLLFRQRLPRQWAVVAAAGVGANHSLFMISRMAMRDNTALLFEVAALAVLWYGFSHRKLFWTFVGGAVGGLTFYTYFPARATMVIWGIFIVLAALLAAKGKALGLLKLGTISLVGFLAVIAPVMIDSFKKPKLAYGYSRQQLLVYPEGQKLQQAWVSAKTPKEGIKRNIVNGLTVFNNHVNDNGYIYPNYRHGFVDPLSGILVWVGLLVVIWQMAKRRSQMFDVLMVSGFLSLWLSLSFLANKAPNYTRLLVILPFMAYLVTMAIKALAGLAASCLKPKFTKPITFIILVITLASIVGWNLIIANDFVRLGKAKGNDIGSTARYIESKSTKSGYHFYLAASDKHAYYLWNYPPAWPDWIGFFTTKSQTVMVVNPKDLPLIPLKHPATIFMNRTLWTQSQPFLEFRYPRLSKHPITPDGQLLAIELE